MAEDEEVLTSSSEPEFPDYEGLMADPVAASEATEPAQALLPFKDEAGNVRYAGSQTPRERSLLEVFAQYDEDVRRRLLAFEAKHDLLLSAADDLSSVERKYPNEYDQLILEILMKV